MEIDFVGEKIVSLEAGQTILEASLRSGIRHFHACGGNAKCSTCRIKVLEGNENLSAINKREQRLRKSILLPPDVRLACQTTIVTGSIKIDRLIKDESDITKQIIRRKHQLVDTYMRRPLGEERHLVLFFLDIRNFTPFVETNLPFDVIAVWRRLMGIFYGVITTHGGQIIETAGDQIYAVFGFRYSLKEAAKAAIESGSGILKELENFNEAYAGIAFPKGFQVGIGIHSGKVIVGEIQLGKIKKTSVMGLAVHIASRIQDSTKTLNNSFVVSEEVLAHSTLEVDSSKTMMNLKGITSPIRLRLLGKPYV